MVLNDFVRNAAEAYPDQAALIMQMGYRTVSLTFSEAYGMAKKTACTLDAEGVAAGDKILLAAGNSPYWITTWFGNMLRGSVIVPLNIQNTTEQVQKIADQTEAKLFIHDDQYVGEAPKGVKAVTLEQFIAKVEAADCGNFTEYAPKEDDLAEIMYTSGTTGDPKGVMLTHNNLTSNTKAVTEALYVDHNDVFLSILPLSHIFEQTAGFLAPYSRNCTIVYAHTTSAIQELMKEYRATVMAAVPEFLQVVMSKIEASAEEQGKAALFGKLRKVSRAIKIKPIQRLLFSSVLKKFGGRLRIVASGGAPLSPRLERKWMDFGVALLQGYGLTETSPVISMNTLHNHRIKSIGKPLNNVEVKIADDEEILVKGPSVFQGYYKNKEKTKAAFTEDGWFKTDDMGSLDDDGFLFISGRKKYMILGPGGQNVHPEDIEEVINAVAGIKDSAVVGIEKESGRQEIHAALLFEQGQKPDPKSVVDEANKKLASYQQIAGWTVWEDDDFPRSATRKVKKEQVLTHIRAKR
ncbi:MAG: AMP-binding protein [Candidatus Kerfeldbacteria bacterium]